MVGRYEKLPEARNSYLQSSTRSIFFYFYRSPAIFISTCPIILLAFVWFIVINFILLCRDWFQVHHNRMKSINDLPWIDYFIGTVRGRWWPARNSIPRPSHTLTHTHTHTHRHTHTHTQIHLEVLIDDVDIFRHWRAGL